MRSSKHEDFKAWAVIAPNLLVVLGSGLLVFHAHHVVASVCPAATLLWYEPGTDDAGRGSGEVIGAQEIELGSNQKPIACDLCGSGQQSIFINLPTGRSMRSDRQVVFRNLLKVSCDRCGLVFSGDRLPDKSLQEYYSEEYSLSSYPEHFFFTPEGPLSRSRAFRDWIISETPSEIWESAQRCLEIGAGAGYLLQEFLQTFPGKSFEGIELNVVAANVARERGLLVRQEINQLPAATFDLIYAVAVLEHTFSPTSFLKEVRRLLKPGGWLILTQPTQDVLSYDIFFVDHLYHFGTQHLQHYADKCGYRELRSVIGHKWMPNFSLHLWQAMGDPSECRIDSPALTTCRLSAETLIEDMKRLDDLLMRMTESRRKLAVFGLNEVYWLAHSYSKLGTYDIACGLDDNPEKQEYTRLTFPVVVPEEAKVYGVRNVLLTMNKIYYPQALPRLAALGLTGYPILS